MVKEKYNHINIIDLKKDDSFDRVFNAYYNYHPELVTNNINSIYDAYYNEEIKIEWLNTKCE